MAEQIDPRRIAKYIDHTALKAETVQADIEKLCSEAKEYGFCSVCVNPRWVPLAAELLYQADVKVCTVIGFPLGAETSRQKAMLAKDAIRDGADEIDMVADLASIIEGDESYCRNDMEMVLKVCRDVRPEILLKVIIESAALNDQQKQLVCRTASEVGVDFVKTSTGFHPAGGANVEDVRLMAAEASRCSVKASGGIRSAADALAMIEAGAARLGTSGSVKIMQELAGGV